MNKDTISIHTQKIIEESENIVLSVHWDEDAPQHTSEYPRMLKAIDRIIIKYMNSFYRNFMNPVGILIAGISFPSKKIKYWLIIVVILICSMFFTKKANMDEAYIACFYILVLFALAPTPSQLANHEIDNEHLKKIGKSLKKRFKNVKEILLFEEDLKHNFSYVNKRIHLYENIVASSKAFLFSLIPLGISIKPYLTNDVLADFLPKIIGPFIFIVFFALLFFSIILGYRRGIQKIVKTIESAVVNVKYELTQKEEEEQKHFQEEQLRLQQEQLQLLREIRDQSRFSALDELVTSGKGFLSRVFQIEKVL